MITGLQITMFKLIPLGLELWRLLGWPMAAMVLATRMDLSQYYGQETSFNSLELCGMGWQLARSRVLINCDNSSVVAAVNKHYNAKEQIAMHFYTVYGSLLLIMM